MPHLRRLTGVGLLVAAYAPLHRLLDVARTGPAGAATRLAAEVAWVVGLSGTLIVLTLAWLAARMIPAEGGERAASRALARRISGPSPAAFALCTGIVATAMATLLALTVHDGDPTSVDEMAQLLHATAVAAGRLTVPVEGSAAAWMAQNGILTEHGWASIYPPLHTILLALGLIGGASWLVGPLLTGAATACLTWSADRLLGAVPGRVAGLLLLVSPFWLLLGASHSSQAAAAAGLSLTLLAGVRARSGRLGWAVATGAAIGFAVSARPWTGLVCGCAIVGALWCDDLRPPAVPLRRLAATLAGGLPFAALLLWWNHALFGDPFRLGYSAAFGPSHGLGLHPDPWGNRYGLVEAVAYTGADLLQLGVKLFESPLPAIAVVGAAMLAGPMRRGARVFAAWAVGGVVAAATYWHHGMHFGPRMLYETAPAWSALFVTAAASLLAGHASHTVPRTTAERFRRWTLMIAVGGGVALAPSAVMPRAQGGPTLPAPPDEPAVVFVHGSWASRISSRLAAAGMRRDSIETALRRNDICAVDRYTRWRGDPDRTSSPPPVDFVALPGAPDGLVSRALSPGNVVRVDPTLAFDAACRREARADRLGVAELEPLAWRLPPLRDRPVMAARDLGPAGNLPVLEALDRPAYVFIDTESGPALLGYAEGMELLWGGAAGVEGTQ